MNRPRNLALLFVLTTAVYLLMLLVTVPRLRALAGGLPIVDMLPWYEPAYIAELMARLGAQGRHDYLYRQMPLDMVYPGLFALTYAGLIAFWARALPWPQLRLAAALPPLAALFDYLENAAMITLLGAYPAMPGWAMQASPLFSAAKTALVSLSLLACLGLGTAFAVRKWRARRV
ncbi:hypothetical protein EII20_05265 [Comamonadaceae bacterium OH2545_COT-014]|nr:hypothetical protein EII20_05265 [Comamonadaceae bacterium OH2545_COT-014]